MFTPFDLYTTYSEKAVLNTELTDPVMNKEYYHTTGMFIVNTVSNYGK
jgi:hypothetical protein